MPYLSASVVVIHYEEALYQMYASLPLGVKGVISATLKKLQSKVIKHVV